MTPDPLTPEQERRTALADDRAFNSGYIAGRVAERAALAAATPDPAEPLITDAAAAMRERFEHGAAKFGRYSWRDYQYRDKDNLERLRRAVDHLEAARRNSKDPAEWRKRAADVANQAFMFADPERAR